MEKNNVTICMLLVNLKWWWTLQSPSLLSSFTNTITICVTASTAVPFSLGYILSVFGAEDCSLELAFLIDSSESAKDNHAQEKRFATDVMDRLQGLRLQTGRGLISRAALLQYSSHVIIEQTFKQWRGADDFKARIAPMVYIGHGTYTTYAITNLTRIYLEESPLGSVKVAILLFDGISHPRNPDIFSAVADAKNQGVRFFAIGITPEANEPGNIAQLRLIASSPASHYLHNLQDRGIVEKVVKEIVSKEKTKQQQHAFMKHYIRWSLLMNLLDLCCLWHLLLQFISCLCQPLTPATAAIATSLLASPNQHAGLDIWKCETIFLRADISWKASPYGLRQILKLFVGRCRGQKEQEDGENRHARYVSEPGHLSTQVIHVQI